MTGCIISCVDTSGYIFRAWKMYGSISCKTLRQPLQHCSNILRIFLVWSFLCYPSYSICLMFEYSSLQWRVKTQSLLSCWMTLMFTVCRLTFVAVHDKTKRNFNSCRCDSLREFPGQEVFLSSSVEKKYIYELIYVIKINNIWCMRRKTVQDININKARK
jgi:hypothetical protein